MFAIDAPCCREPDTDPDQRAAAATAAAAVRDGLRDAVDWAYGGVSSRRSRRGSGTAGTSRPADLCEALADPIVQALMAADGANRIGVKAMMRGVATRLANRDLAAAAARGGIKKGAEQ